MSRLPSLEQELRRLLAACTRAEQLCLEALAQTDRYGAAEEDVVLWEEWLSTLAALHARLAQIRARFEAAAQGLADPGAPAID